MFNKKKENINNKLDRKPKYGMRKLSVGFVSCLLSFTILFGTVAQPVHLIENSVWAEDGSKQTKKENIVIEAYRGGTTVKFKLPKSAKEGDTLHVLIIPSNSSEREIEEKNKLLSVQDIANKEVSINTSKPLEIGEQISAILLLKTDDKKSLDNVVFNITEKTPLAKISKPTYIKAIAGKENIKVGLPNDVENGDILNIKIDDKSTKYVLTFKEGRPKDLYISLSNHLKENENIDISIIRDDIESEKESIKVRAFVKPIISSIDKKHQNIIVAIDEETDSLNLNYGNNKMINFTKGLNI